MIGVELDDAVVVGVAGTHVVDLMVGYLQEAQGGLTVGSLDLKKLL